MDLARARTRLAEVAEGVLKTKEMQEQRRCDKEISNRRKAHHAEDLVCVGRSNEFGPAASVREWERRSRAQFVMPHVKGNCGSTGLAGGPSENTLEALSRDRGAHWRVDLTRPPVDSPESTPTADPEPARWDAR